MRTLVISDIHANLAALEAVLADPHDLVLCLGDIVGFGPDPAACVHRIRRAGGVGSVQGNHDLAWAWSIPSGGLLPLLAVAETVRTALLPELDRSDLAYLDLLPKHAELTLEGRRVLLVHAAPSDPQQANIGPDPEPWARELAAAPSAELLLVGHTHVQFELEAGGARVVNPGSVGLPNDGAATAAYAILDGGNVELKRAVYDVEATARRLRERDLPPATVSAVEEWLRTARMPSRLLHASTNGGTPSPAPTGAAEPGASPRPTRGT